MTRGRPRSVSTDAINHPAVVSGALETVDQEIGQGSERVLRSTGPASKALDENVIQRASEFMDPEKMAMLAFMNEDVTIRIATTTDKQAAQVFETNVNNTPTLFQRGGTYTVKRYVVDHLMRLKETSYTQKEVLDAEGIRQFVHTPHTALKYDFAIIRDDNPLGKSWERAVLAEPG